mmetsp:Transcript_49372/g.127411  ORF Transcript_49372/g.127411 Transcript_49372/m.127411 type:complete len:385 (-) Transcript_49372:157-1311(-)|eukprot:CAMPEP_0195104454 /NCGR_PEP_ID=MMETSP0448-20130528/73109_1 /TAXON_ID=66468 /ORGANISM="Heterocapsa triquestra, Strain CCMP 448" /LENGTH=384 /DNA_ID=CAMNT_0040140295 /DNA_START=97 /DNA_END=1251 /DNA_ORIENTATION=-
MVICNGPITSTFPDTICGAPDLPSVDVIDIVKAVPGQIQDAIQDLEWMNGVIAHVVDFQGLHDLTVTVDRAFVEAFDLSFSDADAVWLAGCWPPQRYAVVSGRASIKRGQMHIQAAGLDLHVDFKDYWFSFEDLRAEIQCHGGRFILGGMGTAKGQGPVEISKLTTGGVLETSCASGWSLTCLIMQMQKARITHETIKMIPSLVAYVMDEAHPVPLQHGCPELLHNAFSLDEYATKDCCEAPFQTDDSGRLLGGQFNGQTHGTGKATTSVECNDLTEPGRWAAMCHTVPGEYFPTSLGTACREGDTIPPSWKCPWCAVAWTGVRFTLRVGPLIFLLLVLYLAWVCYRRRREAKKQEMEYKLPAPARGVANAKKDEYMPIGFSGH